MALAHDPRDPDRRAQLINDAFRQAGYTREFIDFWWNELAFPDLGAKTPTRAWRDRDFSAVESVARELLAKGPAARAWLADMKAGMGNGSVLKRIAAQRPPREIVDRWRAEHSSE